MDFTKLLLSGSIDGLPISLGTGSTLIHTAVTGVAGYDELYVYAVNLDAADHTLTLAYEAGSNAASLGIAIVIPANSPPIPILTGQVIQNAHVLNGLASVAGMINVFGFVNRIQ